MQRNLWYEKERMAAPGFFVPPSLKHQPARIYLSFGGSDEERQRVLTGPGRAEFLDEFLSEWVCQEVDPEEGARPLFHNTERSGLFHLFFDMAQGMSVPDLGPPPSPEKHQSVLRSLEFSPVFGNTERELTYTPSSEPGSGGKPGKRGKRSRASRRSVVALATLRELVALALHGHTCPCVEKPVSALLQEVADSLLPPWMAVELNVPAAVRVRCGHARQTSKELAWRLADEALHGQPWEDASAADRAEVLWELRAMEMDTKDLLRAPLPSPTGTSASLVCAAVLLGVPGFHESETEDVAEPLAEARRLYAEEPDALEAVRLAVDVPLVSKRLSDEEGVWAVALALARDREPEVERLEEASEQTKKEVLQLLHLSCHQGLARVLLAPTDTVPYTLRAMAFAQTVLPPPEGLPVALQETLEGLGEEGPEAVAAWQVSPVSVSEPMSQRIRAWCLEAGALLAVDLHRQGSSWEDIVEAKREMEVGMGGYERFAGML